MRAQLAGVVCPSTWAKEPHSYNCGYVYPPNFDTAQAPVQLAAGYVGKVKDDKIVESLLAKGGIRLASILNTILADPAELEAYGIVNLNTYSPDLDADLEATWIMADRGIKGWISRTLSAILA
jgi:hypothetical protein